MKPENLIRSIREKYVGTAAEHDLLKFLEHDEAELRQAIEDQYRDREERLAQLETQNALISRAAIIDLAVIDFLATESTEPRIWFIENVVAATKGRGLTAAHLRQFADAMEQEPK